MLNLFLFFHLNIAFSAIEECQRKYVIEKCYWPLLNLIKELSITVGVEISGYSLESVAEIDSSWVAELQGLCRKGLVEIIGCGYSQLIGPLVPAKVNEYNLRIGQQIYQKYFNEHPSIALVNEQAFSRGIVEHYCRQEYKAIIMEWENPARYNQHWRSEWRYYPQIVQGTGDWQIPLIWNNSLAFQKFQRYIHGDLDEEGYLNWLKGRMPISKMDNHWLCLYGSDAEIFDFRPGRYQEEAALNPCGEWLRMRSLLENLQHNSNINFVKPSAVLNGLSEKNSAQVLDLTSVEQPIPVKKQPKYNLLRWATTGRNDIDVNTRCYRIFSRLEKNHCQDISDWQELCYLWSSDFRTHITADRWQKYLDRLKCFENKLGLEKIDDEFNDSKKTAKKAIEERLVKIESEKIIVVFDTYKGLAIKSLVIPGISDKSLMGTLEHGYYDDINLLADWYSGHTVIEVVGQRKQTDLLRVNAYISETEETSEVYAEIKLGGGIIYKKWIVYHKEARLELNLNILWHSDFLGILRLGHTTLNPEAFEHEELTVDTHNGGYDIEKFHLFNHQIDYGKPVSWLVSATTALAMTEKYIIVGDKQKQVKISWDENYSAMPALVNFQSICNSWFGRVALTASEMDETRKPQSDSWQRNIKLTWQILKKDDGDVV